MKAIYKALAVGLFLLMVGPGLLSASTVDQDLVDQTPCPDDKIDNHDDDYDDNDDECEDGDDYDGGKDKDDKDDECDDGYDEEIPEFPSMALPVVGVLGALFLVSRMKR